MEGELSDGSSPVVSRFFGWLVCEAHPRARKRIGFCCIVLFDSKVGRSQHDKLRETKQHFVSVGGKFKKGPGLRDAACEPKTRR